MFNLFLTVRRVRVMHWPLHLHLQSYGYLTVIMLMPVFSGETAIKSRRFLFLEKTA